MKSLINNMVSFLQGMSWVVLCLLLHLIIAFIAFGPKLITVCFKSQYPWMFGAPFGWAASVFFGFPALVAVECGKFRPAMYLAKISLFAGALLAAWDVFRFALKSSSPLSSEIVPFGLFYTQLYWGPPVLMGLVSLVLIKRRTPVLNECCQHCEYCLLGNESGVCPECGTSIPKTQRELLLRKSTKEKT
jgi:hypothetical protein